MKMKWKILLNKIKPVTIGDKIALIIGCILILLSIILLFKMDNMNKTLNELNQKEITLLEELETYSTFE